MQRGDIRLDNGKQPYMAVFLRRRWRWLTRNSNRRYAFPLRATARRHCASYRQPERLLKVQRKSIHDRNVILALVRLEEPAVDECVDLAAVKLDSKTAKASPTSCSATPYPLC
jgi:hypothetical protein